ncbi:MAG: toprim domain-containing protein [Burkholderiales bacterium]|nr:toprim domain-containing protein [Burkholderiales bacterium]
MQSFIHAPVRCHPASDRNPRDALPPAHRIATVPLRLGDALAAALQRVRHCERREHCSAGKRRGASCAVFATARCIGAAESSRRLPDQLRMEQAQAYQGLYFVRLGRRSPLDGIGPRELHLDRLMRRATDDTVREVILATNFTVEGEATAHYIGEMLRSRGLQVSRIARGLPVGGELEHVDSGTLAQAVLERRMVG